MKFGRCRFMEVEQSHRNQWNPVRDATRRFEILIFKFKMHRGCVLKTLTFFSTALVTAQAQQPSCPASDISHVVVADEKNAQVRRYFIIEIVKFWSIRQMISKCTCSYSGDYCRNEATNKLLGEILPFAFTSDVLTSPAPQLNIKYRETRRWRGLVSIV